MLVVPLENAIANEGLSRGECEKSIDRRMSRTIQVIRMTKKVMMNPINTTNKLSIVIHVVPQLFEW